MIKVKLLLVIIISCLLLQLSGQNPLVDSLENLLQHHNKYDTLRVNLLNDVASASMKFDRDKAISYASEAENLSDSLDYNKGKSRSLFLKGNYFKTYGDFENAINNFQKSAEICEQFTNKKALINTLKNLGFCYCMIGNTMEGLVYFKKVLQINEEEGNKEGTANAFNNLGNVYQMTGNIELANNYYNKSLNIWKQVGDIEEIADMNNNLGYMYINQDRYYESLEYYLEALSVYEELDNRSRIAMVLNGIGAVYDGLDNKILALDFYKRALAINEELNNKEALAHCLSNLANLTNEDGNYEQALIYYNQAYGLLEELGLKNQMAHVLNNKSNFHKNQGNNLVAVDFCESALLLFKETGDIVGEGSVYLSLARIYFNMNEIEKAENYAKISLDILREFDQLKKQEAAHELLYEIYNVKKDYKNALSQHIQFKLINDSLYNAENVRKITGLEYKYKYENEKQTIELDQQKKDALQAEELRRQKFMRNAFILGFILVLLLAIVILRSYLQKQKANRKLIEQNNIILKQNKEKELLVKEIHHRVKNNLQIISSLFDLQMKSTDNPDTKSALIDGLNRIKSVGLIHQLLYQSEDVINIKFEDFVNKLLDHITSFASKKPINKTITIPQGLQFDINTTIPLGLIITELTTNSFKYAFNEIETCSISINIIPINNDQYKLEVSDNGGGLPEEFDFKTSKSLGLRLVRTLAEQLSGKIDYEFENGAKFVLTFSIKVPNE